MKKALIILGALGLTGALICLFPLLRPAQEMRDRGVAILRVWVGPGGEAASPWLRRMAAAYEKQGGMRVYLRSATAGELQALADGDGAAVAPDLIVSPEGDALLARVGFALILPQTDAPAQTPAPTSALFAPPSPSPGPAATPEPPPSLAALGAIAAPEALSARMEGTFADGDPAGALIAGRAAAALLTPAQAGALPFGYRAYGLENAWLPIAARALSAAGGDLSAFLQTNTAQQALRDAGLFAAASGLRLYGPQDPLRATIEAAIGD